MAVIINKLFNPCNCYWCDSFARPSRASFVFDALLSMFKCVNPAINCTQRQCVVSFSNYKPLVDVSGRGTIFPFNEDVVVLMFTSKIFQLFLVGNFKWEFLESGQIKLRRVSFILNRLKVTLSENHSTVCRSSSYTPIRITFQPPHVNHNNT